MIKIQVLGTGGAFDSDSTAYLVNEAILVDCGLEITKDLMRLKKLDHVTDLYITHLHMDHIAGLEVLMYYRRYSMHLGIEHAQNFRIHAGSDFMPFYKHLKCSSGPSGAFVPDFTYCAIEDKYDLHQVRVSPKPVTHAFNTMPAYSVLFTDNTYPVDASSARVLVSGDTDGPLHLREYGIDLDIENQMVFHDMGWTGLEHIVTDKVHPTEDEVYALNGYSPNLIGIHTTRPLQHYRMATKNEVFYV